MFTAIELECDRDAVDDKIEQESGTSRMSSVRMPHIAKFVLFACAIAVVAACSDSGGGGEPASDFAFIPYQSIGNPDAEEEMMFSELFDEGKPVVLNFWAGQCPPCRDEMPAFQKVAEDYDGDFILLGIDVGTFTMLGTHESARSLLEEMNITFPAGYALDANPLQDYNVTGMPTTIFFSADGEIVEKRTGQIHEDEMRQHVDNLLNEG